MKTTNNKLRFIDSSALHPLEQDMEMKLSASPCAPLKFTDVSNSDLSRRHRRLRFNFASCSVKPKSDGGYELNSNGVLLEG